MDARDLQGFDSYMDKALRDWNAPAVGVGIMVGDRLIHAKGYGYRDYGKKLPFTPRTLFQIASNTKLFTAVAAGLLVEEGKLTWDKPVRDSVPSIRFSTDDLNRTVTLRDMLSHRTGITRHDSIWYRSPFTRAELFERLRYLEPSEPPRQTFLYNNMMYMAVGQLIEIQTGQTWEEFVRQRILEPLDMPSTHYSVTAMASQEDCGVPYTERRGSTEIHRIPYYEDTAGIAPAGAIISNIEEMSHWLIALMNEGRYAGRQVLPPSVLRATLEPAIALPNTEGETRGFWEVLNQAYGMGRSSAAYRGHLVTFHGGALNGFHSQVSFMPNDRIGVIVFVIGDHCAGLADIVSYNVYDRLLKMEPVPWSERWLEIWKKAKSAAVEARAKAGADRVPSTRPSHAVEDSAGDYEHPAYGTLKIAAADGRLRFQAHGADLPLEHFHYDRFDTPDDEIYGKWSVNFQTNPQGDVEKAVISLDEAEAVFTRRPPAIDTETLERLAGTYESPDGSLFRIVVKPDGSLFQVVSGQPEERLAPLKGLKFRIPRFSDIVFEFALENDQVKALKIVTPSGEYTCPRR